jgi:hypothetical protein
LSVLAALSIPAFIASSKLVGDAAMISETRATVVICFSLIMIDRRETSTRT